MAESKSSHSAGHRKAALVGKVDSISGAKTVRVVVSRLTKHPLYGKYVRKRTRLLVHDARAEARLGDTVELARSRPISKRKAWRIVRVVKGADTIRQSAQKSTDAVVKK